KIYISAGDNNSNTNSNIFLGNGNVEKLNLMLAHKDEIIKLKDDVIESLRNEISLLKEKLSAQ
ncbi:XRE family transcriptional regulator, partial [Glaesserella parasuis]|nr:XRE family transcriptional regulator [Glaesserella parasuis]